MALARARRSVALARAGNWVLLLAVVGGAVLLWPTALGGCTTLTVVSGRSTEPTYVTGDLVVARCGPAEVGDVVVYEPPGEEGARVIHRVVDGDATGWVVQGDNNDFLDPWRPTADDVVGVGRWHVPGLGTVAAILLSPLTGVSVLLLALAVLVWPQREATGGASS